MTSKRLTSTTKADEPSGSIPSRRKEAAKMSRKKGSQGRRGRKANGRGKKNRCSYCGRVHKKSQGELGSCGGHAAREEK